MDILAESMCYGLYDKGRFIMVVGLIIFVVGFAITLHVSSIPGVVTMIVGIAITLGAIYVYKEPYKQLKVILSDDYPASELYEDYTIVDQDGKIWILDEKH